MSFKDASLHVFYFIYGDAIFILTLLLHTEHSEDSSEPAEQQIYYHRIVYLEPCSRGTRGLKSFCDL
jgi:hypothetical protein